MRKLLLIIMAFGVALAATAAASAAPAPRASGSFGFKDQDGVQTHVSFDARQLTSSPTCSMSYQDMRGRTTLSFVEDGRTAVATHDVTFTQPAPWILDGSGGYPAGGPYSSTWHVTSGVGAILGSWGNFVLTLAYDRGPVGTSRTLSGTVAADGSMYGTWEDRDTATGSATRTGTFTSPARATPDSCFEARGSLTYSNANGDWFTGAVSFAYVSGSKAVVGGYVRDASNPTWKVSTGFVIDVVDDGEPGLGRDTVGLAAAAPPLIHYMSVYKDIGYGWTAASRARIDQGNLDVVPGR